jgi:hypothetical protein
MVTFGEITDAAPFPALRGERLDLVDAEQAHWLSAVDDWKGVITEQGKRIAQCVRDSDVRIERRRRHCHDPAQPEPLEGRLQRDVSLLRLPRHDQEEADQAEPEQSWRTREHA